MANLANLIVRGMSHLGDVVASTITADTIVGTATKALADESGNNIKENYAASITAENGSILLKNKNGTTLSSAAVSASDTWIPMEGATSSANGAVGYINEVPPKNGFDTKYWRADGTWSVPPNTHYTTGLVAGASATATSDAAVSNNSVFLNVLDDSTVRASHNIVGAGSVTVSSDANGKITITGADTNTNDAVAQTISSTTNANYRVLLSGSADDTTRTEGARKDKDFYYNPSTNTLTVGTVSGSLSGNATSATSATNDSDGNQINTTYIKTSARGANSGVAPLNASGKIDESYLPAYVDDVVEYSAKANFPSTGEAGKIYVDTATNLTYRWSGSAYVEISPSLALGTTSSTAFRGDYGNTAYSHATDANRLTTATASGFYKIAATANGHVQSLTAVSASDITGKLGTTPVSRATGDADGNTITTYYEPIANVKSKGGTTQPVYFDADGVAQNTTYTLGKSVPSNAVFTDANVTQTISSTTDAAYRVLLSGTADDTTRTEGVRKDKDFTYNPSTNTLTVGTVVGSLSGNATSANSATKATQDESGNNIKSTYAASFSISDHTITLKNKNGTSLGTVTVPDNDTWTAMTGATSSAAGAAGYIGTAPPKDGYNTKYWRADGTWAVPPDTHYTTGLITAGSSTATSNAAVTNNSVYLNVLDNSTVRSSHNIVGSGSVTVNSDANGKITITGTDTNTTYGLSISDHTVSLVAGGTTTSVTVPDNNTHYTTKLITAGSSTASANAAVTNNSVYLNLLDDSTVRNSHNIVGAGSVTVNSDANGKITITGTDSDTKYGLSISDHTISIVAGGTTSSVTVPDNNTHYTTKLITGASATASANAAVTNNSVFLNLLDDSTVRNSHNIVGSGSVTVNSDANGKITIAGTDSNNAVTQTISSTSNADYRVLFSATADDTTRTEGARKDTDFKYNPSTNTLTVGTVSGTLSGNATSATKATQDGSGNTITSTYKTVASLKSKGGVYQPIYFDSSGNAQNTTYTLNATVPSNAVFTDTKNTAGSTNSDSKLFLIGATSQAANPQTYSDADTYVTNGTLRTTKLNVVDKCTLEYNATTNALNFVFA